MNEAPLATGADSGDAVGPARIAVLDLARGLAVMGILVINATTIAGPGLAADNPDWHGHAALRDWISFVPAWLLFEGKMRAMFAILFGASLSLFLAGRDEVTGVIRQVRRLLWLAVFGYLHFLLFWWGDILFTYAIAGMLAMLFKDLPAERLFALGIGALLFVAAFAVMEVWWILEASHAVFAGTASEADARAVADFAAAMQTKADAKLAEYAMGFGAAIRYRLTVMPLYPFELAGEAVFEAFPLMMIGMALANSGMFHGDWSRRALATLAAGGIALGLAWGATMLAYLASQDFATTPAALLSFRLGLVGRTAMAAGYLALVVLAGRAILATAFGRRIAAAGRMALSNYLGSTVVMTFLFHGWGLGLVSHEWGHSALMGVVALGWLAMLVWSRAWLARFGIGPLEWVWRRLAGITIRRDGPVRG